MTTDEVVYGIADDPILGKYVDHHPSDRLRLLIISGAVLAVIWFVVTVLLWQVEAGLASTITVVVLALATLIVGWFAAHLWNREVIVYEGGFTYREGSNLAYIPWDEVVSIRQRAERLAYFGGLIRRTVYEVHIRTDKDEQILLGNLYRRINQLSVRLEEHITAVLLPKIKARLADGEHVPFNETLQVSANGIHAETQVLPWEQVGAAKVENRRLNITTQGGDIWFSAPLREVENIRLLLALIQERGTPLETNAASKETPHDDV